MALLGHELKGNCPGRAVSYLLGYGERLEEKESALSVLFTLFSFLYAVVKTELSEGA